MHEYCNSSLVEARSVSLQTVVCSRLVETCWQADREAIVLRLTQLMESLLVIDGNSADGGAGAAVSVSWFLTSVLSCNQASLVAVGKGLLDDMLLTWWCSWHLPDSLGTTSQLKMLASSGMLALQQTYQRT